MLKYCKRCNCELTVDNVAMKNRKYSRGICKPCRSKEVVAWQKNHNEYRKKYANEYARRIGKVKLYDCEGCKTPCYKKYARSFCSDICRFMAYVKKTDSCWMWNGAKNRSGYGKLSFKKYTTDPAHRVAYKLFNGEIPDNLLVMHNCDQRLCVNPVHLAIGSHIENMIDMVEKNRQSSKLKPLEVIKIRNMVEKEGIPQTKICELFNLSSGNVSSIINRRIWKHI